MGSGRLLKVRFSDACRGCGAPIHSGEQAWWDAAAGTVWCLSCHGGLVPLDRGTPGKSAAAQYARWHQAELARLEDSWGRLAGVAKFLHDDPQWVRAWAKGAVGERRVARRLELGLGEQAVLLNDRRVPGARGNIDHVVVAPSGVWVVDAKHLAGRVEQRDVGGWWRCDLRLYVGGRDRSAAVAHLDWQVAAVVEALDDGTVPVHPALCFVEADWPWFAKPFQQDGVWVTWAKCLANLIATPGPLGQEAINRLAARLSVALPSG